MVLDTRRESGNPELVSKSVALKRGGGVGGVDGRTDGRTDGRCCSGDSAPAATAAAVRPEGLASTLARPLARLESFMPRTVKRRRNCSVYPPPQLALLRSMKA